MFSFLRECNLFITIYTHYTKGIINGRQGGNKNVLMVELRGVTGMRERRPPSLVFLSI